MTNFPHPLSTLTLINSSRMTSVADLETGGPIDPVPTSGSEFPFNDKYCPNSRQTLRIAINLKKLIDRIIPIVFPTHEVTASLSPILNENVMKIVYKAAGVKEMVKRVLHHINIEQY